MPGYSSNSTASATNWGWSGSITTSATEVYLGWTITNYPVTHVLTPDEAKLRVERELAVKAAEELLTQHLGEQRLQEYRVTKKVSVVSPSKLGRRYEVVPSGKIKVYENDKLVDELCVHLVIEDGLSYDSWLPEADVILGKVFLLENDEERLLQVANHNPVR